MEHAEALESHAAELYVLGELNDDQADAFEEHYFDCAICADEVRAGSNLLGGGRRLVRENRENVVPLASRRRMNVWLPLAAAAMLVVLVGAPLVMSRATAPAFEVASSHTLDLSGTRSSAPADQTVIETADESIVLLADIPPEPAYESYEARVLDAKGKVVHAKTVSPEQAKNTVPFVLRRWGAGTYELVITGTGPAGQHAEVSRTRFIVKRQGS